MADRRMKPQIEPFTPRVLRREWGDEIIVAETAHYLGKVLKMKAGTKGGLQYHVEKDETFYLVSGEACVICHDDYTVNSVTVPGIAMRRMFAGESYHIPPGAVHQVEAVTDCVFFETSTPHHDDRVRVEKDYGFPEDGGLPTTR